MKIITRKNTKEEYNQLLDFLKSIDQDFFPPFSQRERTLEELLDYYYQTGPIIYLLDDNQVSGMVAYYEHRKEYDCAYITNISILKEYRGQKLGKQLMDLCLNDLKSKNVERVVISTWSTNEIANNFYQKVGFTVFNINKNKKGPGVDELELEMDL